jgi:hypothetical protein
VSSEGGCIALGGVEGGRSSSANSPVSEHNEGVGSVLRVTLAGGNW